MICNSRKSDYPWWSMKSLVPWIAPLIAYGLVFWGCYSWYAPAGFLVTGALLWLDLFLFGRGK